MQQLEDSPSQVPIVRLKPGSDLKEISTSKSFVEVPAQKIRPGTIVTVQSASGQELGKAFYNGHAKTALRVLAFGPAVNIDDTFFISRIKKAVERRLPLFSSTNVCRLIHSEADELPGLVVDRFDNLLVVEFFSHGMFRLRDLISATLLSQFPGAEIYRFSQKHVQKQESFDHWAETAPPARWVRENNLSFLVDPSLNHKTGFFADQRQNRLLFQKKVDEFPNPSDAEPIRIWDVCCHAGGFSIYAKKSQRKTEIWGVDRDPMVLELARQNAERNQVSVRWVEKDMTEFLNHHGPRPHMIVLDPPKQTRNRNELYQAKRRYLDWNSTAIRQLLPGGLLVTCSCTGLLRLPEFKELIMEAAKKAQRKIEVEAWTGAGEDHPVSKKAPQTNYLKVGWIRVTN